ncbi:hypothetical protein AB0A69_09980 [Streptomyces sp. NPDC045431]|uniref:hypothetical protein n=1 Tax=Streptomyces sp. NPDC045431 TaxID=3155613 RepID=UPI00340C8D5C
MTQSGQGQEPHLPAARPAHEGVVLPAEGSQTWGAGQGPGQAGAGPAGGQPWGGPWGPPGGGQEAPPQAQQPGPQHQPPQQQPGAYQPGPYQQQHQQYPPQQHQQHQQHQPQHPLPPQQHQPPQPPQPQPQYGTVAQPLPPEMPARGASDADATQYIPPVARPMPPAGPDAEATAYLPPVPPQPSGAPYGIRPGTPDERQPPAEFDNLFRDDAGAAATQHMPQQQYPRTPAYQQPAQHTPHPQHQQHAQHQPPYQEAYDEPRPASRRRPKVMLIAGVVVGCAVVGLGAGALLSGGGGDAGGGTGDHTSVAGATSPAPADGSAPEAAADPVKEQAEALDKLLAESSDSRGAVIRSVENIKRCDKLDQAASDLRGAASQRRGLVTKLQGLKVDKLPDHAALTAALTKAWQASASADDHYATWATQVKDKKGCKDGRARNTAQTAQANVASGEATAAKRQASGLWNKIAATYGLTARQPEQL